MNSKNAPGAGTSREDSEIQAYFYRIADELTARLRAGEIYTAVMSGEDSDFARVNHAAVRQAGRVSQRGLSVDLIQGSRHATAETVLTGESGTDLHGLESLLSGLRERIPHLPEDPHLLYATEVRSSEQHGENRLPEAGDALLSALEAARGTDFVGLWASGGIYAGFANSLGQRNWFSSYTFNLDWSLYHQADKAVKCAYAGFHWDPAEFSRKLSAASEQLNVLARPPRTIEPGKYCIYLAPVALTEVVGMLGWGGFGLKDHRTKQTTLIRMIEDGVKVGPEVSFYENSREGVAPNFQDAGFIKPDRVTLIERGEFKDCLVSPRSAKEYGVPTNGASPGEFPESFEMSAGSVPMDQVLSRLGTGVYINNLHYLNYSDRPAARMTGMTRFACFWVEGGKIAAPLNVMRFDETFYRMFGENLIGLTSEREMILDSSTYYRRSTGSMHLPGALIADFAFTL